MLTPNRISTSPFKQESACSDLVHGLTPSAGGDLGQERQVNVDFGLERDSYSLVIMKLS